MFYLIQRPLILKCKFQMYVSHVKAPSISRKTAVSKFDIHTFSKIVFDVPSVPLLMEPLLSRM